MRTFRDFMESALYDPERGYYLTRSQTADFYTAPELHPAFGECLADQLARLLRRVRAARPGEALTLVEAGGGDGTLACQVARRLRQSHADICEGLRFVLVERSRRDLTAAVRRLGAFGLPVDAATDIERVERFSGALYSNELFDALPAHLLQKSGGRVFELYVDAEGRESLGALSRPELVEAAASIEPALDEGGRHGVSLAGPQWLERAADRLSVGFHLTADYGKRFAPQTPNPPRAYRHHAIISDLLAQPGRTDLTLPVDFENLIRIGTRIGLELETFQSLSSFLVEGGIERALTACAGDDASTYSERSRIKTLLHPEGMGEAFKVLVQRKGL